VRDVNDADALGLEAADVVKEGLQVVLGEGRRGLVHDEDARADGEGLGDLDDLLMRDREVRDVGRRIDGDAHTAEDVGCHRAQARPVDEAAGAAWLAPEEDVLCDSEMRDEVELLVDGGDARVQGVSRRARVIGLAEAAHRTGVGTVGAGENLHQRGLARAVLTDERVDFPGAKSEVDVRQSLDAGEVLRKTGDL
jgi:hypothetical protein